MNSSHHPHQAYQPYHTLTSKQARDLLHSIDCTVQLNIATGVYITDHSKVSFELVYVNGLNEFTHLHNIHSIKCLNIDAPDPGAEFIPIDWSDDH